MFKLFKRKNEIKELKCRVEVLEGQVAVLNTQRENSKSWGEKFNLKGCTIDGGLIKNGKCSADKASCGNCNKEAVVLLENTEFIDKLANQIEAKISDLVATPAKVDELKVDTTGIWPRSEDVGVINYECVSPKANKITFKLSSVEGYETTITFDKEGMTLSTNKPELKEEFKGLDNYKISEK